ncbi:hypothetical protein AG1IA_07687 [Rhizoctonia solani AG-1 IA]|uniref:Secreted protein n=1 Tax=Thanatephorus cucumeris (strain AG1-IA) TaxID=983506 RepID=L8WPP1_THACA|nr:hypothetical protein AG1IA_07687 [Rhizoctonia solani AG-1 IA]
MPLTVLIPMPTLMLMMRASCSPSGVASVPSSHWSLFSLLNFTAASLFRVMCLNSPTNNPSVPSTALPTLRQMLVAHPDTTRTSQFTLEPSSLTRKVTQTTTRMLKLSTRLATRRKPKTNPNLIFTMLLYPRV